MGNLPIRSIRAAESAIKVVIEGEEGHRASLLPTEYLRKPLIIVTMH